MQSAAPAAEILLLRLENQLGNIGCSLQQLFEQISGVAETQRREKLGLTASDVTAAVIECLNVVGELRATSLPQGQHSDDTEAENNFESLEVDTTPLLTVPSRQQRRRPFPLSPRLLRQQQAQASRSMDWRSSQSQTPQSSFHLSGTHEELPQPSPHTPTTATSSVFSQHVPIQPANDPLSVTLSAPSESTTPAVALGPLATVPQNITATQSVRAGGGDVPATSPLCVFVTPRRCLRRRRSVPAAAPCSLTTPQHSPHTPPLAQSRQGRGAFRR